MMFKHITWKISSIGVACAIMLEACSSGAAVNPSAPAATRPQLCQYATTGTGCGGGGVNTASITELVSANWNSATNSGTATTSNSTGQSLATVNGSYAASSASYSATVGSQTLTVQTLRPDQIQIGVVNQLSDGTLYVDPTTNIVTANVTGTNGVSYTVTATPNSSSATGGFILQVTGSDGTSLSQTVSAPSSSAPDEKRRDNGCAVAGDAERYFGGVAGIAGGVAVISVALGAEPVAAIAAGVSGMTGMIAGVAMLGSFFLCPR